jgi:hypothetical protein
MNRTKSILEAFLPRFQSKAHFCLALSLLSLSGPFLDSAGQEQQSSGVNNLLPFDLNQPFVPVRTDSHACGESDWAFLDLKSTRAALADKRFDILPPITCLAASVPWLPSARIIRVNESLGLDDYREFSVIQGSEASRVWVVPIESGMVGYPHTEDNPHNIAAFNDLLRFAPRKPDENLLLELGNLYQFIVGREEWFDPDRMPKTIKDWAEVNDISGMTENHAQGVTYTRREFDGDRWTHRYMIWKFEFKRSRRGLMLTNVNRSPLNPASDNMKKH